MITYEKKLGAFRFDWLERVCREGCDVCSVVDNSPQDGFTSRLIYIFGKMIRALAINLNTTILIPDAGRTS
jgi:hypothetical protein